MPKALKSRASKQIYVSQSQLTLDGFEGFRHFCLHLYALKLIHFTKFQ